MKRKKYLLPLLFSVFLMTLVGCSKAIIEEPVVHLATAEVPDEAFRIYLVQNGLATIEQVDGKYKAVITPTGEATRKLLMPSLGIKSLKGIELFKNLTCLSIYRNKLESLDLSQNVKIDSLWAGENSFTTLDVSMLPELKFLSLTKSRLSTLDLRKQTKLLALDAAESSGLSSVTLNSPEMENIYLGRTRISSLDLSRMPKLKGVYLYETGISDIDVSSNPLLENCYVWGTKVSSLNLLSNPNLKELSAGVTKLVSLNMSQNHKLKYLNLYNANGINSLDVSNLPLLEQFIITGTSINTINLANNSKLQILEMEKAPLVGKVDLTKCPNLRSLKMNGEWKNTITEIDIRGCSELETLDLIKIGEINVNILRQSFHQPGLRFSMHPKAKYFRANSLSLWIDGSHRRSSVTLGDLLPAVEELIVSNGAHDFEKLDVSSCNNLKKLGIYAQFDLKYLDLSLNKKLEKVIAGDNYSLTLDLTKNPNVKVELIGTNPSIKR